MRRILLLSCALSLATVSALLAGGGVASASGGFTGWSGASPASIGSAGSVSPLYKGSQGCSGYYTGTNPGEMKCRTSADTVHGTRVVVRVGYYTSTTHGFGWSQAYYGRNLYLEPTVGAIALAANPTGSTSSKDYEVYHYQTGIVNQEVVVVADLEATSFKGVGTQDGHMVGVITGYCKTGTGKKEATCPTWVDHTATL